MEQLTLHEYIGQQIRRIREQRHLLQEELARLAQKHGLDWGRDTVAAVETGHRRVSLEEFLLLKPVLEIDLQDLFQKGNIILGGQVVRSDSLKTLLSSGSSALRVVRNTSVPPSFLNFRGNGTGARAPVVDSAETKAAKKLGVMPQTIVETAQALWQRTLSEERDDRAGRDVDARTLQALRGHISRELIAEIQKELERNMKKTKSRRKK